METLASTDAYYRLVADDTEGVIRQAQILLQEYQLCQLKISQMRSKKRVNPEEIALLQNIMREDRRRLAQLFGKDPLGWEILEDLG